MAKPDLDSILDDLYRADPSLRAIDAEVRRAANALLAARPDAIAQPAFVAMLREKLITMHGAPSSKNSSMHVFTMLQRHTYFLTAGALAVVVLAVVLTVSNNAPRSGTAPTPRQAGAVTTLRKEAFGSLAVTNAQPSSLSATAGRGGGGGVPPTAPMADTAVAPSGTSEKIGIIQPYEPIYYTYAYKGTLPEIAANLPVYRRMKGSLGDASSVTGSVRDIIDLSKFPGTGLQQFSVVQDTDNGYQIFADLTEGTVSINQNYPRWPHPEQQCTDEACWQKYRVTEGDVPSDADAIAISDRFLAAHGIDRSAYGAPAVQDQWRIIYAATVDKAFAYVPDQIQVNYPLLVDGQTLYDEGGNPSGISVTIGVRDRQVFGVWGLASNRLERSEYPAETDADTLLKLVKGGGLYSYVPEPGVKTVELTLGEPQMVLMRVWQPNANGTSNELYMPALRFPITDKPTGDQYFSRDNVIIPLIKEVLDQANRPVPYPVLLKTGAGTSGSAGTATPETTR
jgi:hypothetical protein